jgi:hypothetical protein
MPCEEDAADALTNDVQLRIGVSTGRLALMQQSLTRSARRAGSSPGSVAG